VRETLVITAVHSLVNPEDGETMTSEVVQTLLLRASRSPSGRASLVIETLRRGALGGPASVTRMVYTKR
jgi:hypothetical protein